MRLYLREMSSVPLLTREDEIRIAKRIERGNKRIYKALSRSFITIEQIKELAYRLEQGEINPQDIVDIATDPEAEEALEEQREEIRQHVMAEFTDAERLLEGAHPQLLGEDRDRREDRHRRWLAPPLSARLPSAPR